jgi:hypothetical protein
MGDVMSEEAKQKAREAAAQLALSNVVKKFGVCTGSPNPNIKFLPVDLTALGIPDQLPKGVTVAFAFVFDSNQTGSRKTLLAVVPSTEMLSIINRGDQDHYDSALRKKFIEEFIGDRKGVITDMPIAIADARERIEAMLKVYKEKGEQTSVNEIFLNDITYRCHKTQPSGVGK